MSYDPAARDIKTVDGLLESGLGDQGRLEFIRRRMADGMTPYESDMKYVSMLAAESAAAGSPVVDDVPAPQMGESEMARSLVQRGLGDQGRLGYMLRTLEGGGPLRTSDAEYLRAKYAEFERGDMPEAARTAAAEPDAATVRRSADPQLLQAEEELEAVRAELEAASESAEAISRKRQELEAVRAELEAARRLVEEDERELEDMSDYKDRLADRMETHQKLLQEIRGELQSVKDLVKEQNANMDEQVRALEAIRSERMQLEDDSRRLVGVSAELVEERKKLAAARRENRTLKEKGRSLTKSRKDIEKVNRSIQKEREKVAKKLEEEKSKLEEQAALRKSLEQETAKLEDVGVQKSKNKRGIKLAEKVLQESRSRASG